MTEFKLAGVGFHDREVASLELAKLAKRQARAYGTRDPMPAASRAVLPRSTRWAEYTGAALGRDA